MEEQKHNQAQTQKKQPGIQNDMTPEPILIRDSYAGSNKLQGKVAIVTGGDSGIGGAVALHFAKEGANVVIVYLDEHEDAKEIESQISSMGQQSMLIPGDIGDESFCKEAVQKVIQEFRTIDILVNNAAEQHPQKSITDISSEQLEKTFRTNIFSMFYLTKAAMPYLQENARIINTTSVTAYRGSAELLDCSSTKGAIVAFTRSLSQNLAEKKILVNAVAPGPIWTPLIPSTFPKEKVQSFGTQVPLGLAGQPCELAPAYVFLLALILLI